MNTGPFQHELASHSKAVGEFMSRRRLRIGFLRSALRWLPVLTLLLTLPNRNLTAEVVELARPFQTRPGIVSPAPRLAWQVVSQSQTADTASDDLPAPDSDGSALPRIADDGLRPLGQLTLDVRPKPGDVPPDVAAVKFAKAGRIAHPMGTCRPWNLFTFWWDSPAFCHQPLYFEEVNLERYGYSYGVAQPLVSAAHFFGTIPALPYLTTAERPRECIYTLGHYPPGSCAPYHTYYPPLSVKGGLVEAAVVTGLIFALP